MDKEGRMTTSNPVMGLEELRAFWIVLFRRSTLVDGPTTWRPSAFSQREYAWTTTSDTCGPEGRFPVHR